jgi:hypothetical protein
MATTPVSLAQFGQTIKAKHPEYSDLSDEDVASRVLAKYPQYKDMVAQPQATATMSAAPPQGVTGYLQDVQSDLTEGGQRTIVGKGLGYLQGRGSKGYSGLQSGVSPDQAQMMGSVPLGLTKMAIGTSELPSKPLTGAGHILGGALQTATLPSSFVAPEAAEVAGNVASRVASKVIPSAMKQQGADLLKTVAQDANKVPVQIQHAQEAALNLIDWQKTTQLGPSVNKFLQRVTSPKQGPLTYDEARKFYQVLNKLSVDESLKLAGPVKYDLTQMVAGLKQDIGNAADEVGRAAEYYQGLGDYAKGKRLEGWYNFAKNALAKEGIKGVAKGLGVGAGGALGWSVYNELK